MSEVAVRESHVVLSVLPAMRHHIGRTGAWLSADERVALANAVQDAYNVPVDRTEVHSLGELFAARARPDDGSLAALFERVAVAVVHCQHLVVSDEQHHRFVLAELGTRLASLRGRDALCVQAAFAELTHVVVLAVCSRVLSLALLDRVPAAFAVSDDAVPVGPRESPAEFGPLLAEPDRNWLPVVTRLKPLLVDERFADTRRVCCDGGSIEIMPFRALTLVPGEIAHWLDVVSCDLYVSMREFLPDLLLQYLGRRQPMRALLRFENEIVAHETTLRLQCVF